VPRQQVAPSSIFPTSTSVAAEQPQVEDAPVSRAVIMRTASRSLSLLVVVAGRAIHASWRVPMVAGSTQLGRGRSHLLEERLGSVSSLASRTIRT
jgi:hypothetical protein